MIDPRHIGAPVDDWHGLYKEGWKGLICDESFAHPAKFSRALIRRIYDHVIEEGWAVKGDSVVDPFGGVALGAHDAMRLGLNWHGCELEVKFVGLGNQNIALWNERFSRMPNWGTARLVQGDSRKLVEVLSAAECCVSSPPYAGNEKADYLMSEDGKTRRRDEKRGFKQGQGCFRGSEGAYGQSEGQLGAMKEGDHSLVISSPPYAGSLANAKNYADPEKAKSDSEREFMQHRSSTYADLRYGETEGNLGAMPEGQLCVSSPPFSHPETRDRSTVYGDGHIASFMDRAYTVDRQGQDEANLAGLPQGDFDVAVSSPPWEKGAEGGLRKEKFSETFAEGMAAQGSKSGRHPASASARRAQMERDAEKTYGDTEGQMGQQSGETFWSASRLILEQLHQIIVPGGHAVFVVKSFVRDKKVVDFPGQWAQLCEAVGFKLLHDHHALLTERKAKQPAMDDFDVQGDTWRLVTRDRDHSVARKSFFRRLAESKGSPKIDYENVLCFEKPQ